MKKILVPVDFSDVTELVIENAKIFAKLLGAEMKIIHVFAPALHGTVGRILMVPLNYEDLRDELAVKLKSEHKKMLEIKQKLSSEKINVTAFLLGGNVSETVLSQVEEYAPDMIVMGSHGHGRVAKALLGSITTSVLKHTKCPIIIVPNKTKS